MKIEIEIPKEFENDFNSTGFQEFFERVIADMNCMCGNYERETAEMFIKIFKKAKLIEIFATYDCGYAQAWRKNK